MGPESKKDRDSPLQRDTFELSLECRRSVET